MTLVFGGFLGQDVALERQNLIDTIESELNDKRGYAVNKCLSLLFGDSPYAIKKYGTKETAQKITAQSATDAYREILRRGAVEIIFIGSGDYSVSSELFSQRFSEIERDPVPYAPEFLSSSCETAKSVREEMDVTQGKLVMGFRTQTDGSEEEMNAMELMVALYGVTPFSKLFQNVREKLSLCYYCSARYDRPSGILLVDSGVETGNEQKAQDEILHQLDLVKSGDFDENEIAATLLAMVNSLKTTEDSLSGLESWYLNQVLSGTLESPLDNAAALSKVTKAQIQKAASQVSLDTTYFLAARKQGVNDNAKN